MRVAELISVAEPFTTVVVRYGSGRKAGYVCGMTYDIPARVMDMEVISFRAGAENSDGSTMMVADGIMEAGITIIAR